METDEEWKRDKLCLSERETERVIHINELQTESMSIKYIYIRPKHTADSAGMIKHSCLACIVSLSLSPLSFHFFITPFSSIPFPFSSSSISLYFMDARLIIGHKTASFRIQIYVLRGKTSLKKL